MFFCQINLVSFLNYKGIVLCGQEHLAEYIELNNGQQPRR
jgi:hypothetical protein